MSDLQILDWLGMWQGKVGTESMLGADAVALYPSIETEMAHDICRDIIGQSKINIRDVNYKKATRYIALNLTAI